MGCGASATQSESKGNLQPNRSIRINIIEATSILDYEDTDVGSIRWSSASNRQSPVGSGLPRSKSPSYTIHKQTVEVQLFDRPQSPVPNHTAQIHQTEKISSEAADIE